MSFQEASRGRPPAEWTSGVFGNTEGARGGEKGSRDRLNEIIFQPLRSDPLRYSTLSKLFRNNREATAATIINSERDCTPRRPSGFQLTPV